MTERVEIDLTLHHETSGDKAAFFLSRSGDMKDGQWVPKSVARQVAEGKFSVERWKAEQCGFLIVRDASQMRLL